MFFNKKSGDEWSELRVLLPPLTLIAFGYIIIAALGAYREWHCSPKVIQEVPILGTDWVAQMPISSCGFGWTEMIDIRVTKLTGHGAAVLATGSEINQAVLDGSVRNHLRMTIPQGKDIEVHTVNVPGLSFEVTYRPTPSRDALDR